MGRPKKKRKPARRRKSVNEGSAPVDRSDPATWGPREGPVKKVGKSTLLQMYEQGGLTPEQLRAARLINEVFMRTTAALRPQAVDLNRVSSHLFADDPEWYTNAYPIYKRWLEGFTDLKRKKVIMWLVIDEWTLKDVQAETGLSRPKIKEILKASLDEFISMEINSERCRLQCLDAASMV